MISEHAVTLALQGDIDVRTATTVKADVAAALEDGLPDLVVLDLAEVSFLDSAGIGFLVALNRQIEDAGAAMRLRHLQPRVERALAVTGLQDVLRSEDTP